MLCLNAYVSATQNLRLGSASCLRLYFPSYGPSRQLALKNHVLPQIYNSSEIEFQIKRRLTCKVTLDHNSVNKNCSWREHMPTIPP